MTADPLAELLHRTEDAMATLRRVTEQMGTVAAGAAGKVLEATAHPTTVTGGLRRGAEDAIDLSTAWVEPVRHLSEEQQHFAHEVAIWAERNRQFAEQVAAWAESQQAFAERLEAWTNPFLTLSEQIGASLKTAARVLLPEDPESAGACAPAADGDRGAA